MKKLLVLTILFACGSSKEKEILAESFQIHEAAMKVSAGVQKRIEIMNAQLDSLQEDQTYLKDSVVNLTAAYNSWEEAIVEVPGFDDHHNHDHHNHEGHDHHDHAPSPDLTAEMVLEIQKEIHKGIKQLDTRSERIFDQVMDY